VIEAGSTFPKFDLPTDDGKTIGSKDLAGKPYVIYFYPKDDTSGCTLEGQEFTALMPKFDALGARVVGVSPDTIKSHCKFRDKYELTVTLAADEQRTLIEALGLWVDKQMYGKVYKGVERTTYLVDGKGKIAQVWPKVKVPGHAGEVLAAAKALAAK
jgi:thioredoxin-dependent peroxiredoxin